MCGKEYPDEEDLVFVDGFYDWYSSPRGLCWRGRPRTGSNGCQAMIASEADLRADIVVAAIPSYGEPLNDGLLRFIQPRVIIIHDSKYPIADRASAELLKRLRDSGVGVFSVRQEKGIRLTITRGEWRLENSTGVLWRSRKK